MRRLALFLATFAALSVGLVPVADGVARIEAALAAAPADGHGHAADHADGHGCGAAHSDCGEHAAKPHPGHCPACTALPSQLALTFDRLAPARPALAAPERLLAAFPAVDIPPPRPFRA